MLYNEEAILKEMAAGGRFDFFLDSAINSPLPLLPRSVLVEAIKFHPLYELALVLLLTQGMPVLLYTVNALVEIPLFTSQHFLRISAF